MSEHPHYREDEREAIYIAAEVWLEKTQAEAPDPWGMAFHEMARLQKRYSEITYPEFNFSDLTTYLDPPEAKALWRKAYKILQPLVGRVGAVAILANIGGHFAPYKISISRRGPKGRPKFLNDADSNISRNIKSLQVGTAIMIQRQNGIGIVDAQKLISGRRIYDFVPELLGRNSDQALFGNFEDTKKHWQAWKRDAVGRGYADSRAVWAEIDGKPWPSNQFWLDEI